MEEENNRVGFPRVGQRMDAQGVGPENGGYGGGTASLLEDLTNGGTCCFRVCLPLPHARGAKPRRIFIRSEAAKNVRAIVRCKQTFVKYPQNCPAARSQQWFVDGRAAPDAAEGQLVQAFKSLVDALFGGGRVLFHCEYSYHCGPIVAAAFFQKLTGVSYKVAASTTQGAW